jgi:hypothetical protein
MLERDVIRKYRWEMGGALALYVLVLFGSLYGAKTMDNGALRIGILLLPLVPVMLAVWAVARQFRRMDEYVRLQSLESVAIAAAVTAGWTLTYGFLENAGFPRLSMFWVWPVMGAVWGLSACARTWSAR